MDRPDDVTIVTDRSPIVPISLPEATSGHRPYSYSVSRLPHGVPYDRHRHQITGTPCHSAPRTSG